MKHENYSNYKYGLLVYSLDNIGDYIQSIAARQFLPRVDTYLHREYLNKVKSKEKIKLILNGWFMHFPENWPPSDAIYPLFVSFHVSPNKANKFFSKKSIAYLKKYEPIGTRDTFTMELLRKEGIESYFSGCLTLTLNYKFHQNNNNRKKVLIVDLYKELINYLPKELRENAEFLTFNYSRFYYQDIHKFFKNSFIKKIISYGIWKLEMGIKKIQNTVVNQEKCFKKAEECLVKLLEAKLVITSRLHCALPCLAFNTPVIFVHKDLQDPRIRDWVNFFNSYSPQDFIKIAKKINLQQEFKNPGNVQEFQNKLIAIVKNFLKN